MASICHHQFCIKPEILVSPHHFYYENLAISAASVAAFTNKILRTKVKCLSPQIVENTRILFGLVFKWTHLTVFNLRNGFFFFPPQKRAINDETGQAEDSREQQHSTALATNVKIKVSVNKSLQNQDGFLPNKLHRDIWSEQQINPFSKQILQEQTLTKK